MAPLDLQLAFLERLRPLTRSELPYRVLWCVTRGPDGLGADSERKLREDDRNTGRVLALLDDRGLIVRRGDRWTATAAGRRLVSEIEKATETPPSSVIEGCRLLSIAADPEGSTGTAERLLAEREIEVLYADGTYELIAVLPDDLKLVRELREQLHRVGHRVQATRIVGSA